jgi:hypothetical protein
VLVCFKLTLTLTQGSIHDYTCSNYLESVGEIDASNSFYASLRIRFFHFQRQNPTKFVAGAKNLAAEGEAIRIESPPRGVAARTSPSSAAPVLS